jgi:O-acetyl-ADP-ribose deacetylase (regulator of RNase III)
MTTVKLPSAMTIRGVTFPPGTVLPCLATSQLVLLKHTQTAWHHLLAGLYAWLCQAEPSVEERAQVASQLAAVDFPMPAKDGAPPMPWAVVRVGGMVFCLLEGNLALATAEVLVNDSNDQLHMGGGVAGALRSRGGMELEAEARRLAPARMGEIVRTSAGRLSAREIYHAVVIEYAQMNRTELGDVKSSFHAVLETALEEGVASIAVPMLGCGIGGLQVEDVTSAYLSIARQVSVKRKRGMLILLMAFGDEDAAKAARALAEGADPSAAAREAEEFLKEAARLLEQVPTSKRNESQGGEPES